MGKVTPICKAGDNNNLCNYRPIFARPCCSKIVERIMYNRVHKYKKIKFSTVNNSVSKQGILPIMLSKSSHWSC